MIPREPRPPSPVRPAACVLGAMLAVAAARADVDVTAATAQVPVRSQSVRAGLHVISSAGGNVAVWSGPDGVVLVDDSLASLTPQLVEAVTRISSGPLRFVVNTHWHPDHAGGNEALARSGAVIVAHDDTRGRMDEMQFIESYDLKVPAAPKAALPILTFADTVSLHLNGDHLVASHVAAAHTDGDVVVWWENANAVHLGDLFYAGSYPFIDLGSGGSLAGVVAALEVVLARADAKTVVIPGHGPVTGRAELAAYRDMLVAVGRRVRELVEQGRSEDEVLAARPTADFDERYGKGGLAPERFVRQLYADLAGGR